MDSHSPPFNYDTPNQLLYPPSGMNSPNYSSVSGSSLHEWRTPNTDDWQTAGSPNKRRRTEDGDDESEGDDERSEVTEVPHDMAEMYEPLVHDSDWYKETGDCVIRVEDTLFKVHRAFLSRDSSAFEDMFALPPDQNATELDGSSDDKPLPLIGDTVKQLRALLWILYALPHQIADIMNKTDAHLSDLLTIAEMTNKYHFVELAAWCNQTLMKVVNKSTLPPEHYDQALRVAVLSGHQPMLDAIVSTLTSQLLEGALAPSRMINVADEHQIRGLQGAAYYAQLMKLQDADSDIFTFPEGCNLSKEQRIRLLSGYWCLVRHWDSLQQSDSVFASVGSSQQDALLLQNLQGRWREHLKHPTMTQSSPADVLSKLKRMQILMRSATLGSSHYSMLGMGGSQNPSQQQNMSSFFIPGTQMNPNGQIHIFNNQFNGNNPGSSQPLVQLTPSEVIQQVTQGAIDGLIAALPDFFSDRVLGLGQLDA